ncbi:hypothetical protein BH23ACT11_BH23ACT11_06220 [soil metagenome]
MSENNNSYPKNGSAQIGPTLKKAREDFGLTHEDVERVTKIRERYLDAMERDDYDALPGIVYAQGFLKTYANYLELDGEKLARELKDREAARSGEPELDEESTSGGAVRSSRSRAGSGPVRRPRRLRLSPIFVIGAVLGLILLIIVVGGLYLVGLQASRSSDGSEPEPPKAESAADSSQQKDSQKAAEDPAKKDDSAAGEEDAAANEEQSDKQGEKQGADGAKDEADGAAPAPEPTPTEPPPPDSLVMEIRVDGNISWLNIEVDGEHMFVEVAQPGFYKVFEAKESITVWSGNAGAVFLTVNGQDYGQFGGSGLTKIQEFTLKSAEN